MDTLSLEGSFFSLYLLLLLVLLLPLPPEYKVHFQLSHSWNLFHPFFFQPLFPKTSLLIFFLIIQSNLQLLRSHIQIRLGAVWGTAEGSGVSFYCIHYSDWKKWRLEHFESVQCWNIYISREWDGWIACVCMCVHVCVCEGRVNFAFMYFYAFHGLPQMQRGNRVMWDREAIWSL